MKANNIFSLGKITIPLANRGLTLVTGYSEDEGSANGAGKSSLANKAILWGLFGQTAGGIRADDVINRHLPSKPSVSIGFTGIDGKNYVVERSRKPAKLEFFIESPGHELPVRLTARNEKETQELINKALGRDFKSFLQTDFFGQGRERSYLALDPREQKEILEQILPIDKISEWADNAKKSRASINNSISEIVETVHWYSGQRVALKSQIRMLEIEASRWGKLNKQKIEDLECEINTKAKRAKYLEASITDIESRIPSDIEALTEQAPKLWDSISMARESLSAWIGERNKLEALVREIHPEICPTCNQAVNIELTNRLQSEQKNIAEKLDKAKENVEICRKTKDDLESRYSSINTKIREANGLSTEIWKIRSFINTLDTTDLKKALEAARTATNPCNDQLLIARDRKEHVDYAIETLNDHLNNVLQPALEAIIFWLDAFSKDLKNYMLSRVCPFLDAQTEKHLKGLGNTQLKVSFTTVKLLKSGEAKEDFNVQVESSTGGKGFNSLSGGEQQMISFAVGLALADLAETQVQGASQLLILDEPFMALDSRNCENLVSYLSQELSRRKKTILLISNEEGLKSLISNRIHVVKRGGITSA